MPSCRQTAKPLARTRVVCDLLLKAAAETTLAIAGRDGRDPAYAFFGMGLLEGRRIVAP
jgi:hypothetical protein